MKTTNPQTVYISGKITGDKNYKKKFARAEKLLRKLGFKPINPAKVIPEDAFAFYSSYISVDLAILNECECIFMLKDWEDSNGARIEKAFAEEHHIWDLRDSPYSGTLCKLPLWDKLNAM